MKMKFYCCSYRVANDKHFLTNISLSGAMGKGAMIGKNFKVIADNETYIILNCTEKDIEDLQIGDIVTEFMNY
jgi:hypothetical protein